MTRSSVGALVVAWALLHAGGNGDWGVVDQFPSESTCMQVRAASIDEEARGEIGSALADQPLDNPMRQDAYRRATRRVGERYRCAWQDS